MRPGIKRFAKVACLVFDLPIMATFVRISFRALCRLTGVKDADYFYDRTERVWVAKSHSTYIAVGFHVARLWPTQMHRYLNGKLAESMDLWYLHNYEPPTGSVIFDIGAGDGTDTVLFARSAGPTGRVFSIEAHPKTARLLRATCRHNKFGNVTIIEAAIMGSTAKVRMSNDREHPENHVVRDKGSNSSSVTEMVDATTIDTICLAHGISRIDFLKMNIEGAEVDAIQGMTTSIKDVRRACIACHDFIDQNQEEAIKRAITNFLTNSGFETESRQDPVRPWVGGYVYCERRDQ